MTASAIEGDRERCLNSGMNNYLAKPVRAQTLKALLESYLNKDNETKDIPDLAAKAKTMVKVALHEQDTPGDQSNSSTVAKKVVEGPAAESESSMTSRPPNVRKITAKRIRPNGDKEDAPAL